ncbi:RNA-binding motif, single-stranded-interacting protein 1-like isoform X2 [Sycon ciliatum]|uniref:RNA-binding motif, single-stranded-interacting protein 1-like isoform X2 n=1 Tax=Sycon ciliatum TaxID=27933 RepID=UPI0031F6DAE9
MPSPRPPRGMEEDDDSFLKESASMESGVADCSGELPHDDTSCGNPEDLDGDKALLGPDQLLRERRAGKARNGTTNKKLPFLSTASQSKSVKFPATLRGLNRGQQGSTAAVAAAATQAMAQWPYVGVSATGSPIALGRPGQQMYPMSGVMAQLSGSSPTGSLCAVGPSLDGLVAPGTATMTAIPSTLQYATAGSASQAPPNMVLIPPSTNGQHDYSLTNLYIRGLGPNTKDTDLYNMCCEFGTIISTKAIVDKATNLCKGYGFVDFETHQAAATALTALKDQAVDVHFARLSLEKPHGHGQMNSTSAGHSSNSSERASNLDTTNLYIANLPYNVDEKTLESILEPCGTIVSTRILRDLSTGQSKGVGFCRMQTKESCERAIAKFNGQVLPSFPGTTPLHVKFADISNRRRVSSKDSSIPTPLFPETFDSPSPLAYDVGQAGQVFQFQQFLPPYQVFGRPAVPVSSSAFYGQQAYMQQAAAMQASQGTWPASLLPGYPAAAGQQAAYLV